jgi:hypothetical protein
MGKPLKVLAQWIFPFGLTQVQAKRLIKTILASLISFIFCIVSPVAHRLGSAVDQLPGMTVTLHPGRRTGEMIEAVVLAYSGMAVGLAYATLGRFAYSQLRIHSTEQKALGLLAALYVVMLFVVGILRSLSPRLYQFGFMVFNIVAFSFLSNLSLSLANNTEAFSVPILLSTALCLFINIVLFPELGSAHLGFSILGGLNELHSHVDTTVAYFVTSSGYRLSSLQAQRATLRNVLTACNIVLAESSFEMSYSFMAPRELKPVLRKIEDLASTATALVGACELEYALLGDLNRSDNEKTYHEDKSDGREFLRREIAYADQNVLLGFLKSVRHPVLNLSSAISRCFDCIKLAVAYGYDVPDHKIQLMSSFTTNNITLDVIDDALIEIAQAITIYDSSIPNSLERALFEGDESYDMLLPREEYFLLASFLLNLREFANKTRSLLVDARDIVELRRERGLRGWRGRSVWFFSITSKTTLLKYLWTGQEEPMEVDVTTISSYLQEDDGSADQRSGGGKQRLARNLLIDILELPGKYSHHMKFTFKYTLLLTLLTFPAFSVHLRGWYLGIKGSWVAYLANLIYESSIGGTADLFVIRAIGMVVGSAVGYAAYAASSPTVGGYAIMCVIVGVGISIGYYYMLVSPYPKSAMVAVVNITAIILSAIIPPGGNMLDLFEKRCLTMLVGGAATMVVQVTIFPAKARVALVEQIIDCVRRCITIQDTIALGVDGGIPSYATQQAAYARLDKECDKAKKSLAMAETYSRLVSFSERRG